MSLSNQSSSVIQGEITQLQDTSSTRIAFKNYYIIKRFIDLLGAFIGIVLSMPIFLLLIVIMKIQDPKGPVIFRQWRIGENGKKFAIYKFRSMVRNAEKVLKSDEALYKKYIENNYKLEPDEDPRITKIGYFLRKSSLDELPQLINVLIGNMSLVGPRPVVEVELKEYKHKLDDFLSVKPGITGYWQVCGRSDVGYPERVDLELYYVYNKSIKL
ncbi:sugar transferase, partial [Paenibacillus alkaliterrae]